MSLFALVAVAVFVVFPNHPRIRKSTAIKFLLSFDTGSLKVIMVTYRKFGGKLSCTYVDTNFHYSQCSSLLDLICFRTEIVMSCAWNLDIEYPSPFSQLLALLSIFSLDFLAIECFQGNVATRFYTTGISVGFSAVPTLMPHSVGQSLTQLHSSPLCFDSLHLEHHANSGCRGHLCCVCNQSCICCGAWREF